MFPGAFRFAVAIRVLAFNTVYSTRSSTGRRNHLYTAILISLELAQKTIEWRLRWAVCIPSGSSLNRRVLSVRQTISAGFLRNVASIDGAAVNASGNRVVVR